MAMLREQNKQVTVQTRAEDSSVSNQDSFSYSMSHSEHHSKSYDALAGGTSPWSRGDSASPLTGTTLTSYDEGNKLRHQVWSDMSDTPSDPPDFADYGEVEEEEDDDDEPEELGPPPSVGSVGHVEGTCKPCGFFIAAKGCRRGEECDHCHYPHQRSGKAKPCKKKRDRAKKYKTQQEQAVESKKKVIMSL